MNKSKFIKILEEWPLRAEPNEFVRLFVYDDEHGEHAKIPEIYDKHTFRLNYLGDFSYVAEEVEDA